MASEASVATGSEPPSVVDTLASALERARAKRLPLGELLDAFGERAFGLMLILLSLPNCVLAPPLIASVTAGPIAFFGAQMLAGRERPWLPEAMRRWSLPVRTLRRVLDVAGPRLRQVDAFGRPRAFETIGGVAERLTGLLALVAALIVLLPVPGTNVLPAFSLVFLCLGLMRRDGVLYGIGVGFGVLGLVIAVVTAGLAVELVRWAWRSFGL